MENVNALELIIKLVAKTGLFFAKVDGNYSDRERAFINAYIEQLMAQGGTREEVRELIGDVEERNITFEEVMADTHQLLGLLPPTDASMVKMALFAFINDIVKADGDDCLAEKEAFKKWNSALAQYGEA